MALPAGITKCTVTIGSGSTFLGEDAVISGSVVADRNVVWSATGQSIYKTESTVAPSMSGGSASFVVPHVDQPGFVDSAGNAVTNWYYVFNGRATFDGNRTELISKRFQVLQGQTTVDLDLVPDGPVIPGVTTPSAAVTSVNGQTGAVTVAGADNATVAGFVTGAGATKDALADSIADYLSEHGGGGGGGSASSEGLLADRPAAASVPGSFYLATDDNGGTLYRSSGAIWRQVSPGASGSQQLGYAELGSSWVGVSGAGGEQVVAGLTSTVVLAAATDVMLHVQVSIESPDALHQLRVYDGATNVLTGFFKGYGIGVSNGVPTYSFSRRLAGVAAGSHAFQVYVAPSAAGAPTVFASASTRPFIRVTRA